MSSLFNLIAQQLGVNTGIVEQPQGAVAPPEDEILVNGIQNRPQAAPMDMEVPNLGNQDIIAEAQNALSNAPERTGMFGARGALRDILGYLGDAFLVQGGADRIYAPRIREEQMMNALSGLTQNPDAAIERMAQVDPAATTELFNNVSDNRYKQGVLQSQDAARKDMIGERAYNRKIDAQNQAARYLQAADTPEKLAFALQQIQRIADYSGTTLEELGIPAEIAEAQRQVLSAGDMTVNQQQQLPLAEQRVQTGIFNAETGRINATRSRPGRAETDSERYVRIMDKAPDDRTVGEAAWANEYGQRSGGSGNRFSGSPPPPAGSTQRTAPRFTPVP